MGHMPAPDQLMDLHKEFDLTNAASADLDIMSRHANIATVAPIHLPLDGMDVVDRREIQMPPPHERRDGFEEALACHYVARHRSCLDHSGALPVLADAFIILNRRTDTDRRRRRGRIGTQAQIGAEYI